MRSLINTSLLLLIVPATAFASDYSHTCRTADGQFEMHDQSLYPAAEIGNPEKDIPYTTLKETVLSQETGYCLSNEARGQKFTFENKTYVLKIAFEYQGNQIETDAICELAASGLPAMYNCDRTVVTSSKSQPAGAAPKPLATGPSTWTHNGSIMSLSANGATREFRYAVPRKGIRNVGVRPGTVLFTGERQGDTYTGTAYIFAKGCNPSAYPVAGYVTAGERSIVMTGKAPRIGDGCTISGFRDDELVFDYVQADQ